MSLFQVWQQLKLTSRKNDEVNTVKSVLYEYVKHSSNTQFPVFSKTMNSSNNLAHFYIAWLVKEHRNAEKYLQISDQISRMKSP